MTMKKPEEARRRLDETIALARDLDDRRLLSDATRNLGLLELESGNTSKARELALKSYEIAEGSGLLGLTARTPDQVEPMIAQALKHDGPAVVEVFVARQELAMPPTITLEQAKGFSLFMLKAVLNGRGDEIIDLARVNLLR